MWYHLYRIEGRQSVKWRFVIVTDDRPDGDKPIIEGKVSVDDGEVELLHSFDHPPTSFELAHHGANEDPAYDFLRG